MVEDMDPTNDPPVNDEGHQAPFPPVWPGDPQAGHHRSCGIRVRSFCTCGQAAYLEAEAAAAKSETSRLADMTVAAEYLHDLMNLPNDVHIVGCYTEHIAGTINFVFVLEAFSDNEFPSSRVTARYTQRYSSDGNPTGTFFDGWESVS
jgi:hypothetical protein